jgi:hypothetical protein
MPISYFGRRIYTPSAKSGQRACAQCGRADDLKVFRTSHRPRAGNVGRVELTKPRNQPSGPVCSVPRPNVGHAEELHCSVCWINRVLKRISTIAQ